jgi:hemolysin III
MHFLLAARDPTSAWTHFAWMVLAVPGTAWLLWLSRHNRLKQLCMFVYGLSLVLCYGGSFLYHAVPLDVSEPFNVVDHVGIYLLIAGSVTAIGAVGLRGMWRSGLLLIVWILAVIGSTLRIVAAPPLAVCTAFYLLMGWVGVLTYFHLVRRLSHRTVSLLWIGGLLYSTGAVLNVCGWPTIDPQWFTPHDLFHVLVMAGSLTHFAFVVVVLSGQSAARRAAPPQAAMPIPSPLLLSAADPLR